MAGTGERRRPQKYPDELRERAVRMVLEIRQQTGERHGAVTRVAKELGIGTESLRGWVNRFAGTRIAVYDVLEYLAGGMSAEDIVADFPELTDAHIRAALEFAASRERRLAESA